MLGEGYITENINARIFKEIVPRDTKGKNNKFESDYIL